ncbi:aminoglycoside N(3)-acetyltransferase [Inconstantimicrobium mannanitabidum]|uniref:AAC(3) family N-acetyltransferase n=1 Tax=Inconstantimicrobium mannanitabidum TaxID=1604901 RepID=A0ACB5RE13_9CLOT|nr:AAC(3) family N-acetyltransferase [Clostridium sp. TW13]GKX67134.1 AAC(3) family N-acetyltransferase [Clostridium sp. TW13]
MGQKELIDNTPILRTRESIVEDLRKLGLKEGMTVIVHSSLSSMGWVCGGSVAVVQALMDVVTPNGNIIMPEHSGEYSDPCDWCNPPVPKEWWQAIRDTMPAFDPKYTPSSFMGVIAETFRNFQGVVRSNHPAVSFAAWGKDAQFIVEKHSLDYSLGENSPLARIYDLDGYVLLLGVSYENNTSFHLAENRVIDKKICKAGAPIIENGKRAWKAYEDIDFDTDLFEDIGKDFENKHKVDIGAVGSAKCRIFKQRAAVDYAEVWIQNKRQTMHIE